MKFEFSIRPLFLFSFFHTIFAYDESANNLRDISLRLPSTIRPEHYFIKLNFNAMENVNLFHGEVNITINVLVPVNEIILHARQFKIDEIYLMFGNGSSLVSSGRIVNSNTDFLNVKFARTIPTGKYTLHLKYIGSIINNSGVIRGFYEENDNSTSFIATRLYSIGARQIFPCWDEPSLKANFTIMIRHDARFTALSNMHTEKIEYDDIESKMQTTIFANSPKMSTYSVGFVVSKLAFHESSDGIVRVWSRNSTIEKMKYSLDLVLKILSVLENITNIRYKEMGLQKLDIVVLPKLIQNTESWGLTTIKENIIVDDADKESRIRALSHLCARQWFGNLVSAKSWSDMWFHETIINYLGFLINKHFVGSLHFMDEVTGNGDFSTMREYDSLSNAKDIQTIGMGSRNLNLNDVVLLYYKPMRIFHMISYVFGENHLQQVWQNYLHNHAFQNSTVDGFIDVFKRVEGVDHNLVREVFHNWITTPGVPLITVQRNYTTGTAIISQSRYLQDRAGNDDSIEKYWVPINYAIQDSVDFQNSTITHWLTPNNKSIEISGLKNDSWIILNKQSHGYYCVNYDTKNWILIIETLRSSHYSIIPVWNRAQIFNDAWDLASSGQLHYGTLISLMGYLEHETSILPWIAICQRVIFAMEMKLFGTKYYIPFKKYLSKLPNKLIEKIGFEESQEDDHATKLFRTTMLYTTCGWFASSCIDKATVKLQQWLDDPERNVILKVLRRTIFCNGIRGSNREIWETMWKKWIDEQDNEILYALGCSLDERNINQLLSKTTDVDFDEKMVQMIFNAVRSGSELGQDYVIEYIIQNWRSIKPSYRHGLFHRITMMISQKDQFDKVSKFVNSDSDLENTIKSDLNMILQRIGDRFTNHDTRLAEMDDFLF